MRTTQVLIGLATLVLATFAGMTSLANTLRELAPSLASSMPGETQAQLAVIDQHFTPLKTELDRNRVFPVATAALRAAPLNPPALRLMAFALDSGGQGARSAAYAQLADKISRRDFLTELLMVDRGARTGDTRGALEHIDAALRAHPMAQPVVFPILRRALVESDIRQGLSRYLGARAQWALSFIPDAANDSASAGFAADVAIRAGRAIHPDDLAIIGPVLVTRTVQAGSFDVVPALLDLMHNHGRAVLSAADLSRQTVDAGLGMASWQVSNTANSSANFVADGTGERRSLSLYAASGARDTVASKLLYLAPGDYLLTEVLSASGASTQGQAVEWRLACLDRQGGVVWQGQNILDPANRGSQRLTIPAQCRHQRLELIAMIDLSATALDLTISNLHLARLANSPSGGARSAPVASTSFSRSTAN